MEDTTIQDKELQGRVEEFNKEFVPLLGKYELGLGASAFINPNGTVGARPVLFDARKKEAEQKDAPAAAPVAAETSTAPSATPAQGEIAAA